MRFRSTFLILLLFGNGGRLAESIGFTIFPPHLCHLFFFCTWTLLLLFLVKLISISKIHAADQRNCGRWLSHATVLGLNLFMCCSYIITRVTSITTTTYFKLVCTLDGVGVVMWLCYIPIVYARLDGRIVRRALVISFAASIGLAVHAGWAAAISFGGVTTDDMLRQAVWVASEFFPTLAILSVIRPSVNSLTIDSHRKMLFGQPTLSAPRMCLPLPLQRASQRSLGRARQTQAVRGGDDNHTPLSPLYGTTVTSDSAVTASPSTSTVSVFPDQPHFDIERR